MIEIKVPVLPESVTDATIVSWHKKAGDQVKRDEVLVELETDKVVLEVPSESNGVLKEIKHKVGDVVLAEQVLAIIEQQHQQSDLPPAGDNAKTETVKAPVEAIDAVKEKKVAQAFATPAIRQLMREKGIDADQVTGSGKDGRILKKDVLAQQENSSETISDSKAQDNKGRLEERVPMTRLRQTVAQRLLSAKQETAMLTTFNELDMSAVMAIRNQHKEAFAQAHDIKLGFMSFFVKVAVEALKKFPAVNAYIEDQEIVYHAYCDIGVAVSSKRGLVVPVLSDAHEMTLAEIEKNIAQFSTDASSGQLSLAQISGGTFTITNGGVFGSMLSTPILNPPQSAILGMHNIKERAVVVNGEIVIRPVMYLALSYDHRIIDGKEAVLFLRHIKESLEEPARLLLGL